MVFISSWPCKFWIISKAAAMHNNYCYRCCYDSSRLIQLQQWKDHSLSVQTVYGLDFDVSGHSLYYSKGLVK